MNHEIEKYIQSIYEKYGWSEAKEFKQNILNYVKKLYEEIIRSYEE